MPVDRTNVDERVPRELMLREAVMRGDEQAWRLWYDLSASDLRAYVVWRCGGRQDVADELIQDVWLIAVRGVRRFDPREGAFGAWLRGIAANVLRNHQRKRPFANAAMAAGKKEPALREEPADGSDRHEQAGRVAQALSALSDRHEAVLRAKYLDQQSVADIARSWNETTKTIESLLTRARESFRREFGRLDGERLAGGAAGSAPQVPVTVTAREETALGDSVIEESLK